MKKLMRVEDVCEILNLSRSQIYALLDCGRLKGYRLTTKKNGAVRFSERQIEDYLAASETGNPTDTDDMKYL